MNNKEVRKENIAEGGEPVVKCPRCGAEIDYLFDYVREERKQEARVDKNGRMYYLDIDEYPLDFGDEYECPECQEVLFYDEDEAVAFLRGEVKK